MVEASALHDIERKRIVSRPHVDPLCFRYTALGSWKTNVHNGCPCAPS
jgi:hypothetical protein